MVVDSRLEWDGRSPPNNHHIRFIHIGEIRTSSLIADPTTLSAGTIQHGRKNEFTAGGNHRRV
jgi:hypothetical protein